MKLLNRRRFLPEQFTASLGNFALKSTTTTVKAFTVALTLEYIQSLFPSDSLPQTKEPFPSQQHQSGSPHYPASSWTHWIPSVPRLLLNRTGSAQIARASDHRERQGLSAALSTVSTSSHRTWAHTRSLTSGNENLDVPSSPTVVLLRLNEITYVKALCICKTNKVLSRQLE